MTIEIGDGMDADNLSADEELESGDEVNWTENDSRVFRHLRDVFAEVVRPYVAMSLGWENRGYAYDDRAMVIGMRDEILYGRNFFDGGMDEAEADAQVAGNDESDEGGEPGGPEEPDEDEESPPVTEQEVIRESNALATALAEEWISAIVETAMVKGRFELDADLMPDNFDPEMLYMYPVDPKEDLGPIMLGITERLFDAANPVELPLGLQITEDSKLGKYVVAPKFRLG